MLLKHPSSGRSHCPLSQPFPDDVQAYLHFLACIAIAAPSSMNQAVGALGSGCSHIACGSTHKH